MILLDVRVDAGAYATGHIPGAIHAPMGKEPWRTSRDGVPDMLPEMGDVQAFFRSLGMDNATPVVVYHAGVAGDLGDVSAATRAYWTLRVSGHDRVSILDGGLAAWRAAELPVVLASTLPEKSGGFRARFNPGLVASLAEVEEAYASGSHRFVDARPAGQLTAVRRRVSWSAPAPFRVR